MSDRAFILDLQQRLETLVDGDDYLIVSIGVRGPNVDCRNGNAVATVRMGDDSFTYEALYLDDAIAGARGRIIQERRAREEKRQKDRSAPAAGIESGEGK